MTDLQVLLRALAEAYAQLDFARAELRRLTATESADESEADQ